MLTRLREEHGSAIVTLAITLPLLLIIGTFAVDVGNWFTHRRHLQTQADAAAIAGGSRFALPCSTNASDPFDVATVNGKINATARDYAGPSATYTGPSPLTFLNPPEDLNAPYNTQVGGTLNSKIHVLLNSTQSYDQGGSDFSDGQPCDANFIDVKITEKNLPWFFNITGGSPISAINVQARAKLLPAAADKGFIPIGVQLPKIYKAQATITRACDGQSLATPQEVSLAPLPAAQQTDPSMTLWGPDPSAYPTGTVPVSNPGFLTCSGTDFEGINVNVQVSGSPLVTPTTSNCANQFVECYDTVLLRAFKDPRGGASANPEFGDVRLLDGGGSTTCSPGTPYWSSGDISNLPCTFLGQATVDWGDRTGPGFSSSLTMSSGGGQSTTDASAGNGTYTFTGLGSGDGTPTGDPQNVRLSWSWVRTDGTWRGNTCTTQPLGTQRNHNPCFGSGSTVVHRANARQSSPVLKVVVSNPNTGIPLDSFDQSPFPGAFSLTVGIEDTGFAPRQKAVLRNLNQQGSGALNCNADANGQFDPPGKIFLQFQNGCTPFYAENRFARGQWEPCPSTQSFPPNSGAAPWLCVAQAPGNQGPKIVPDGLDVATGNCDQLNGGQNQCQQGRDVCHNPSQYDPSNPNQTFDLTKDKRIVKVFLVPFAGLKGITGNGQAGAIEVAGFAAFYLTNWNGNPCASQDDQIERLPPGADAVGHFVKVQDPSAIPNPGGTCQPSDVTPCVVVLVR